MQKRIKIDDNHFLVFDANDDFVYTMTISGYYLENNKLEKAFYLSMWDDFSFNAYVNNYNISEITFTFNKNHPLYNPLKKILNTDNNLLIDDDLTLKDKMKYLNISMSNNVILLSFVNKLSNQDYYSKKFNVFIKNIMPDCRSKIDRQYLDTKEHLCHFFNEVRDFFETCISENQDKAIEKVIKIRNIK